jgi:hypothetical protein
MTARKMLFCLAYSIIQQDRLSRAPRLNRPGRRLLGLGQSAWVSRMKANENLVGRVLQPCAWLVQLPGSFANELAELVTIGNIRDCPKNQIRTHEVNLLPELSLQCYLALRYR